MEEESPERGNLIFVDSSYFIARADKADHWHEKALKISEGLLANAVILDYVILEAVTVIGRRGGGRAGTDLYEYLINNFQIVYVDEDILRQDMKIYLKYEGALSVADVASIEIMRRRDIKKIASFDADFDRVPGISRVH